MQDATRSFLIEYIIRDDVREMLAYRVPDARGLVKLDAMENPYQLPDLLRADLAERLANASLNRYPGATTDALRAQLKTVMHVPKDADVIHGNGSDELIAMIALAAARPGAAVLVPHPCFVMYEISAHLARVAFHAVPLCEDFSLDVDAMLVRMRAYKPAVIYLAYPNNPTGNLFDVSDMESIIRAAQGDVCHALVVVDEAYQPFAQASMMPHVLYFSNLLVMRTVSKLGLAGIRLGFMAGHPDWIAQFDKVRPPYNVNILTETAARFALEHIHVLNDQADHLRADRTKLAATVAAVDGVTVFPSAANFLLLRVPDAAKVHEGLIARKVLVKDVSKMPLLANCLRVTVGTPNENETFVKALRGSLKDL